MTLRERIKSELTAAMRSGQTLRRDTLRMVQSSLYNAEKSARREFGDDEVIALLAREVKTRRESVEAYRDAGRVDLATKEEAEIDVISAFLPEPLSATELAALVDAGIAATGASSARDLGKVMGWLSPRTRGRADGRAVSGLVAKRLAARDLAAHDAAGRH